MMQNTSTRMSRAGFLEAVTLLTASLVILCGCTGPDTTELLEARLRENEVLLDRYEREVGAMESKLKIAQREAKILREQIAKNGKPVPAVEATTALAAVDHLKFNRLLTAGQDKDSKPGDERFHAIVVPYDAAGELVKVLSDIELEAIDLSLPEDRRTIGKWNYTADQASEIWHAGYLSSGYRFEHPWKELPQGKEVLLSVKLKTPDGRELTANHTVKITPPTQLESDQAAPMLVEVPADIRQASEVDPPAEEAEKEKPQEKREVEEPKPDRPEPVLDLFELPAEKVEEQPGKATIKPISLSNEKVSEASEKISEETARPFPAGIQTSDNYTDASIPYLR